MDKEKILQTIEILKNSIRYHRRFMLKSYATDSEIENCKESIYSCIYSIRLLRKLLEN